MIYIASEWDIEYQPETHIYIATHESHDRNAYYPSKGMVVGVSVEHCIEQINQVELEK